MITTVISQHIATVWFLHALVGIARLEGESVWSEGDIAAGIAITFINCYVESIISSVSKYQLERERERGNDTDCKLVDHSHIQRRG